MSKKPESLTTGAPKGPGRRDGRLAQGSRGRGRGRVGGRVRGRVEVRQGGAVGWVAVVRLRSWRVPRMGSVFTLLFISC